MKKAVQHFPWHNPLSSIKKWIVAFMLIIPMGLSAQLTDSVTTSPPLTDNNGQSGISFNVGANAPIRIVEIMNDFNTTASNYTIWYNTDSINGAPTISTANGWVAYQTGSVIGTGGLVGVQLSTPLEIPAGETYGFYIEAETRYHTFASGDPTVFSDGKVYINTGSNVGYGGGAPSPTFTVRQFLGTIIYENAVYGFNDAAVLSVDSPTVFCAGMQDIYASIGNYGLNQLDSVEVHWEFNGTPQPTINYTQLLDTINGTGQNKDMIFLGSAMFNNGVANTITVWTESPNGGTDTTTYNDTLEVVRQASLSGNFTIDPSIASGNGNYQTFIELSDALNQFGVCGPLMVTVSPGTYNGYLELSNVAGVDSINTITIDGVDSSLVNLSHDGSERYATVSLSDISYITIKNMGIENTNMTGGVAVLFSNNTQHNVITNNLLKVSTKSTVANVSNVVFSGNTSSYSSTTMNSRNNIIANNNIIGGYYGIRAYGSSSSVGIQNQIINNDLTKIFYYGIYAYYQDSLEIKNNYIDVSRGNQYGYGLAVYYSTNYIVSANELQIVAQYAYPMYLYNYNTYSTSTRKIELSNNMVSSTYYGLFAYYIDSMNLYHNTFYAEGSYAAYLYHSKAPYMNEYDVRNNIFYSGSSYAFYTNQPDTMFFKMDNNIYYTGGTNLLRIGTTNYPDLISFQTASPFLNTASLEGDPEFFTPGEDLHLLGTLANDVGDNSVGITVDIDGDTRPIGLSTTVDIGADEYDVPTCMPVFNLMTYNPTLDSITIAWAGNGNPYEYEIVESGNAQGSGVRVIVTSDSLRIGGLNPATGYDIYVREICTRGDSSQWRPSEFHTADTVDFFEDFEDFSPGLPSNGWTTNINSDTKWLIGTSGSNAYNPLIDHTIGTGGTFAHFSGVYAATEDLNSIPIYTDTNDIMELSFWYHNAGSMSTMNVYVDTNGTSNLIAHIPGNQQADRDFPWKKFSTYIKGYSNQYITIKFEGTHVFGYDKEVAVDDVTLRKVPEFEAALVELIQPSGAICAGTVSPVVGVMNVGQVDIDSIMVFWDINGIVDSLMYNNTILSGDTAQVALGNITFNSTTAYNIKFYIKNPNSTTDPDASNDTLSLDGLRTGMIGNYTIDATLPASSTNFVDFESIATNLSTYGVCGSVYVTVASGTYSEAVYLSQISGVSASDTVVFDGVDSSTTIISQSSEYATWTFDGAQHVTLKNMSIENNGTNNAVVLFANEANYNTISNSELNANTSSTSSLVSNIVFSASTTSRASGAKTHFNTIANNKVNGGYYGLYQYGNQNDLPKNTKILNNVFRDQYYYGIYMYYADSMDIVGNDIDMTDRGATNAYGAYVYFSFNIKFNENYVHSGGNCLQYLEANGYVYQTRPHEYNNNMLISDNGNGLYLYLNMWGPQAYAKIHHTSISANGSQPAIMTYLYSTPIDYDIRNSILSSSSGTAMTISNQDPSVFSEMDYNIYNTNGGSLFSFDGTAYSDLSSFQSAYPLLNANSLEGDPQYEDPTSDLHIIYGTFANDVGDNTVGILYDIDGDSRPIGTSTVVDIGADEFDPPTCPILLNLDASNASPDSITLSWDGLGGTEFQIEIVGYGDPQGSGDTMTTISDEYRAGGLTPYTEYEFYVREVCSRGDTSLWAGPFKFRTDSIFNDIDMNAFLTPVSLTQACYSNAEDVEVLLVNNGNMNIDFNTDNFDVYVDVTGAATQSYSVLLDDNSLNSGLPLAIGDTLSVYMGNLDMTVAGNYNFNAYISSTVDLDNSNDTLGYQVVNSTSGGILDLLSNVCGSGIVNLSTSGSVGDVQWQRLVGNAFVDETSADSVVYEVFVDSTVSFRVIACGTELSDTLVVTPDVVPTAPSTLPDTAIVFCGDSGTAVLTASTVLTGIEYNWYADSSSTMWLSNSSTYNYGLNTSMQSVTTFYTDTFYVSVRDTATDCESELSMVTGTVICTVGEEEMPSVLSGISIYPNPSQGVFQLIGNNVEEVLDVSIYNTNGKMVYHMDAKVSNNFNEQIDISGLSKGMYFIKFQGKKSMEMRKVVIH